MEDAAGVSYGTGHPEGHGLSPLGKSGPKLPSTYQQLIAEPPKIGGALERETENLGLSRLSDDVREKDASLIYNEDFYRAPHRRPARVIARTGTEIEQLRAEYYDIVDIGSLEYIRIRNTLAIDHSTLFAAAGIVGLCRVRYLQDRSFEFDEHGLMSVIVEALDSDGESVVDLVAWPVHRPDKFASALRRARGLGITMVANPSTYFGDRPLRIFRTPLAWLTAGCEGVVIIDHRFVSSWLTDALGTIAGEDLGHAREIARALHPFVDPSRILAPIAEAAT